MFRKTMFFENLSPAIMGNWKIFFAPGISLVSLGILIAMFPQILVAMISLCLLLLGSIFLFIAWQARKIEKNQTEHKQRVWQNGSWEPLD